MNRYRFGPRSTPSFIKTLITITLILSFVAISLRPHFPQFYSLKNPVAYLALSTWGITRFFLWQLISYVFIPPIGYSFSFSFIIYLGFTLYLLWVIGTSIWELKGGKDFIRIFFGSALVVGIVTLVLLYLSGSPIPFSGITPTIYALLAAWLILYPDIQLLLFLFVPVKAKWLVLIIVAFDVLSDITSGQFIHSISTITALLFGYFYGIFTWNRPGPFYALHRFDWALIRWKQSFTKGPKHRSGKIYDIQTGKSVKREEDFMDNCLAKISKYGKKSLSLRERWKMNRIAKKKRRQK